MPDTELKKARDRYTEPPDWLRYTFALVTVVLAIIIRMPFERFLQGQSPFLTFVVAAIAAAWYGGLGPAVLSIVVGGFLAIYFIVEPAGSVINLDAVDFASLLLYSLVGVTTALISGKQRAAQRQASRFASQALQRQHELTVEVARRGDAEKELQRVVTELERSNRELEDFAFVASHDLQEPLRKILAFGERLSSRHRDTLGDEGMDYLDRMLNASIRMQNLINDLLSFSRVTTKARPPETTDLNRVLRDVLEVLQATIEAKKAHVELDPLPTIEADPSQMRQLFQNLVGNAIKFQPDGRLPEVRISAHREEGEEGWWTIEVADNGIGFDIKHLDRIFTIFQRLHGRGEYEGSGIGLAICRKIVERHGGAITAESNPGHGSTFKVYLPERQK